MKKIYFVYIILLLLSTINGYGQITKEDVSNYLIERKVLDSSDVIFNTQLINLNRAILDEKIVFYDFIYKTIPVIRKVRIGIIDGNIYAFPVDYNLLTKYLSKDNLATEQYVLTLMEILLNEDDIIESHNTINETIYSTNYKYEVVTWQKLNGVRSHFYFSFKDNKINIIYIVIAEIFTGDYENKNDILIPPKGETIYYRLITQNGSKDDPTHSVRILNYNGELITFTGNQEYRSQNINVTDNNNPTPLKK